MIAFKGSISRLWTASPVALGLLWGVPATAQPATNQLVIAQGTDAVTMDPHNTTQMTAMQPFNFVYEKLLNRDKDMRLIPELAEAWKSLDPTTWEILLRKGVKFHNGEDFNAEAVKFTLDRVRVSGATAVSGGFTTIAEVRAIDANTVHIVTKQPDPLLPARLAQWGAQMLPRATSKKQESRAWRSKRLALVRIALASGERTTRSYLRPTRPTGAPPPNSRE